jgi:hypothetical protein
VGTDHGTAAPLFVFGSCVKGGVIGENPTINTQLEPQEGVEMQYDFRAIYASILKEWFGVSAAELSTLISGQHAPMNLTQGCEVSGGIDDISGEKPHLTHVYPNPLNGNGNIVLRSEGDWTQITLCDQMGRVVMTIADKYFDQGEHTISFDTGRLPQGSFHVRAHSRTWQEVKHVVKL